MNINRTNYEEYFLLAIDKELDAAGVLELESFLNENPDLRFEWEALRSSILTTDASNVGLIDKSSLLGIPQKEQLQENLMLLLDNEFSPEMKLQTLQLIATDSQTQREFTLLQNAKLVDVIENEYPWKNELYKKEARKLYPFYLRIAAAVIFISGVTLFYLSNNSNNNTDKFLAGKYQRSLKVKNSNEVKSPAKNNNTFTPIQPSISVINNHKKNKISEIVTKVLSETVEEDTKTLPHSQAKSALALQPTGSVPVIANSLNSFTIQSPVLQNIAETAIVNTPTAALATNAFAEEDENTPVQIFITDTNKRNKTRALVRKLVRFAGKAAELVTASSENENAIQIASFEIPRK